MYMYFQIESKKIFHKKIEKKKIKVEIFIQKKILNCQTSTLTHINIDLKFFFVVLII